MIVGGAEKNEEVDKHTKRRKLREGPGEKFSGGGAAAPPAPPLYPSLSPIAI